MQTTFAGCVTTYYVLNENTLGYVIDVQPTVFGILHASVLRGASSFYGPKHLTSSDVLRPATMTDFSDYRVAPPPPSLVDAPDSSV